LVPGPQGELYRSQAGESKEKAAETILRGWMGKEGGRRRERRNRTRGGKNRGVILKKAYRIWGVVQKSSAGCQMRLLRLAQVVGKSGGGRRPFFISAAAR